MYAQPEGGSVFISSRPLALVTGASSGIGEERVLAGSLKSKAQGKVSRLIPDSAKAEMHRKMAEPGSAKQ